MQAYSSRSSATNQDLALINDDLLSQNLWEIDFNARQLLRVHLGTGDQAREADSWLLELGQLMSASIARNAVIIDKQPPKLIKFDRRGKEIDFIEHPAAGLESRRLLWSKGRGAFGGARQRDVSLLAAYAAQHLLAQCDTGLLCACGMTPAVATFIRRYGDATLQQRYLPKLEATDYDEGWRGSIWFTENETGGSDLGNLQTTARYDGSVWRLTGVKWFCSVADADLIMTIARPEGAPGGARGLCLFLLPRWLDDARHQQNSYSIRRLKAKLGCKSVPSGEVELRGALAYPCCGADGHALDGKGLARAMSLISPAQRAGVALMGEGITRRVFASALCYASQRRVFGRVLTELPMMQETLLDLMVESEASAALVFKLGSLLEQADVPKAGDCDRLQRILTPIVKFRCCRRGVETSSRALEVFGGNGFIEDWPMERLLRDSQNHTLWEGTELVLCMDVLRAMPYSYATLRAFLESIRAKLAKLTTTSFEWCERLASVLSVALSTLPRAEQVDVGSAHVFANYLADVVQFTLLCEQALWSAENEAQYRSAIVAANYAVRHGLHGGATHLLGSRMTDLDSIFKALTSNATIDTETASRAVLQLLSTRSVSARL